MSKILKTIIVGVIALNLWGCRSDPTHFYVLDHLATKTAQRGRHKIDIGIGPVKLPKYLNQPQIVTREQPHKLHLDEYNRWAEGLDDNVTRVLGDNIATLMPACRIFHHPWQRRAPIDVQIMVDIRQFEFVAQKCQVVLRAGWTLNDIHNRKMLSACQKTYSVRLSGHPTYHNIARVMSQSLYQLSRDIVQDMRYQRRGK